MSSFYSTKDKNERSDLFPRSHMDAIVQEASSIHQNMNNNFSGDQLQISESHNAGGNYDTPTTPQTFAINGLLQQSRLSGFRPNGQKDLLPNLFSPAPRYHNNIMSPEYYQRPNPSDLDDLFHSNINNLYYYNPIQQYVDLEDQQKTPISSAFYQHNNNLIQSNYSLRNTPINPISPHVQIMHSGGIHNPDFQQFTPKYFNNNNLFGPLIYSPLKTTQNRLPLSDQNEYYEMENDAFGEINNLEDWVEKEEQGIKQENIKEEIYNANQQFGDRLQKKIKVEDKDNARIEYDHHEMNSYTEVSDITGDQKRKMEYNPKILTSSVKTMKQNYNISPDTEKYQVTPCKNFQENYVFNTPNNQQEVSKSDNQRKMQSPSHINGNIQRANEENKLVASQGQRQRSNQGVNSQYQGNRNTQKDGNMSDDENGGGRNERGLRILSKEVLDIVCRKDETTYKEVTDEIIQNRKKSNQSLGQDEQNIKRRVYDALNVLIAADLISKTGKKIKSNQPLNRTGSSLTKIPIQKAYRESLEISMSNNQQDKLQNFKTYCQNSLQSKKDRLQRKFDVLKDLILKTVASKNIIERNAYKEMKTQQQTLPSTASSSLTSSSSKADSSTQSLRCISLSKGMNSKEEDIMFRFPFIACQSPPNNSKMSFKKFTNGLAICSIQQLKLKGDIDILVQLYKMNPIAEIEQDKITYLPVQLSNFMQEVQDMLYKDDVKLEQEITVSNNKHIVQQYYGNENLNTQQDNPRLRQVQNQQKQLQRQPKNQHQNNEEDEGEEDNSQNTINQSQTNRREIAHQIENQNTSIICQPHHTPDCHQNCEDYEDYINNE